MFRQKLLPSSVQMKLHLLVIYIQICILCNICIEESRSFCRNMSVKLKIVILYLKSTEVHLHAMYMSEARNSRSPIKFSGNFMRGYTPLNNVAELSSFSVMPALKRTRLTASAWRKANWCINCVLMRVMERRERDNS